MLHNLIRYLKALAWWCSCAVSGAFCAMALLLWVASLLPAPKLV